MTCRWSVNEFSLISCLLFLINCYPSLAKRCPISSLLPNLRYLYLLPDYSPMSPQSNHASFYPMLYFTLQFLMILSGCWFRPVFLSLDFWHCAVELLPCLIGWKLEPYFKDILSATIPSSVHEFSKIFLTEDPSGWLCSPNPPNILPPLWSSEIPTRPHTTPQSQNGPNYHFYLSILSAYDPPAPHYENLPQVFQ